MNRTIRVALPLVLGVAAFVGLAALIVSRREDNGLLVQSGCPLTWRREALPIMVVTDTTVRDWVIHVDEAMAIWAEVHPQLLMSGGELDPDLTGGSVVPVTRSLENMTPEESRHARTRLRNSDCWINSAVIEVPQHTYSELRTRVVAHELGHLLGLAHDTDPNSVMYPRAIPGEFEVTRSDSRLLLDMYGLE